MGHDEDQTVDEYDGLLTLDEEDPTIRGEILRAQPVAHERDTELSGAERHKGSRESRLRAIARKLVARLDRD